jgi:hypothetical protein
MFKMARPEEVPPEAIVPFEETIVSKIVPEFLTLNPAVTSGLFEGGLIEAANFEAANFCFDYTVLTHR